MTTSHVVPITIHIVLHSVSHHTIIMASKEATTVQKHTHRTRTKDRLQRGLYFFVMVQYCSLRISCLVPNYILPNNNTLPSSSQSSSSATPTFIPNSMFCLGRGGGHNHIHLSVPLQSTNKNCSIIWAKSLSDPVMGHCVLAKRVYCQGPGCCSPFFPGKESSFFFHSTLAGPVPNILAQNIILHWTVGVPSGRNLHSKAALVFTPIWPLGPFFHSLSS